MKNQKGSQDAPGFYDIAKYSPWKEQEILHNHMNVYRVVEIIQKEKIEIVLEFMTQALIKEKRMKTEM